MKLSKKKLTAFCQAAFDAAANGSHDHIMEVVRDQSVDAIADLLRGHGIDYDKLPDQQQEDLRVAYSDGVWNPNRQPDHVQIIIHVEDGLVQGVIANTNVTYLVADCDTDGAEAGDLIRTPKLLQRHIGSARRIFHAFKHEADADAAAVIATLATARKE
jgi:hypothetical protein